jgi:hypothetical protein
MEWDMGYGIWDMGYGIWDEGCGMWSAGRMAHGDGVPRDRVTTEFT